jgi:hypothetical protein
MTTDELKRLAETMLKFGVERMLEHGDLQQMFNLVRHDGAMELVTLDGAISNNARGKDMVAATMRRKLATGNHAAVLMLSDAFWARTTPEQEKIRQELGLNVEQAAAAGLCEKHEAVICTVESPFYHQQARQGYRREDGRIVLDGTVETMGSDDPTYKSSGRFFGMFPAHHA